VMKNSVTVGITMVLAIILSLYLTIAFAETGSADFIKSMITMNPTKNTTNMSQDITVLENTTDKSKSETNATINSTNLAILMSTTNNQINATQINATQNTTNEGKKIESEVRKQVKEMQRDTENVSKGNANEVKSALSNSSY
jgi:hypothetical protein